MRLVLDRREEVAAWVAERVNRRRFREPYQAIGYEIGGQLCGGHVFEDMTDHDVHIHIAGSAAVSKGACRVAWDYAFKQAGCKRISALVRADNTRMNQILPRLGFQREATVRRFYDDVDGVLWGLLPDDAKSWMR
jgi:RimJ/RimL family protein N-acetyltransferase